MAIIRRVYVYLVCAITLQALTWAVITLLWDLDPFGTPAPIQAIAGEIAAMIVAAPLFLVHWLWARHLAASEEERKDIWRRIYLYAMQGVFLGAFAAQVFDLLDALLDLGFGQTQSRVPFPATTTIMHAILAMIVLAIAWLYHWWTTYQDSRAFPETGGSATVRRLYVFTFSAAGLTAMAVAAAQLLRWTLYQFGTRAVVQDVTPAEEIARLLVGVSLWLVFWLVAQHLYNGPSEEERESALRKFYLYLVVFVASIGVVLAIAFILDEVIRQALGLAPSGDLRNPVSILLTLGIVWAFHHMALRADASRIAEIPQQVAVRRLYLYLVAGIGLAAFLGGLIGEGNVLIRSLTGESMGAGLKELLAWSTAALIAGLPVWLLPWRQLQRAAVEAGPAGAEERRSIVRKLYLYLYLFFATITVLIAAIDILSQVLSVVLGGRLPRSLLTDLSQTIGFALIAICVWIYHGLALRGDGQIARREQDNALGALNIAVVDAADGQWGCATLETLKRELPGVKVQPVGLTAAAATRMGTSADQTAITVGLQSAGLIVGPWTIAAANVAIPVEMTQAVAASAARKLLVPIPLPGWEWIGVARMSEDDLVREIVRSIKRVAQGQDAAPGRPAIVTAVLVAIALFIGLLVLFFAFGMLRAVLFGG